MAPNHKHEDISTQLAGLSKDVMYIREKLVTMDEARQRQWESINQMKDGFTLLRGGFRTLQLIGAALVFTWGATLAYFQIQDRFSHSALPTAIAKPFDVPSNELRK